MPQRIKFFLAHLSVSFLIALLVVGLVFFIWYPTPLAQAVGVTHIFLMMLAIDVIVGPALGFIVYKRDKKKFKFDLSIIILIQLSALSYGVYSIAQGRPVWIAYNVDRFELIRNNEIIHNNLQTALSKYQQPSWFKPQFVGVAFAKDKELRDQDMFQEMFGGISIAQKPERHVPLIEVKKQIKQRTQSLDSLKKYNSEQVVATVLANYPQAKGYVPLKANHLDMTVLLDQNAEVIKIVNLRPW